VRRSGGRYLVQSREGSGEIDAPGFIFALDWSLEYPYVGHSPSSSHWSGQPISRKIDPQRKMLDATDEILFMAMSLSNELVVH
jgi:hypothetical protein